ncbi:NACHT, LRR and PYD domains-containing protein 3-like [Siniperca chuatsi]|uniref:NACHT, LRR and PYD domains-containing protein 3-like n=1 Tax=Siniperca chuatsi TaxID=119488 RepID=UPI001CE06518|nr:NACHT, LRR and PYD domains-containing protein 3-like [Siniperca chuatsi]
MGTVKELLLETLENLGHEELKSFKWYLQLPEVHDGFSPIPKFQLDKADMLDTVNLMVQKYNQQAAEVAKKVLGKMSRNDLVQHLSNSSSELKGNVSDVVEPTEDTGASPLQPQASPVPHPLTKSSQPEDMNIAVPEPPEQIILYQRTLQSYLQSKFMCAREGMTERTDEQCLVDIFTELFITTGGEIHINEQHEVMQIGMPKGRVAVTEKPIEPSNIFKSPTGNHKPIRTVLTTGVAGIGKTFLVQKFVLDWAEGRKNQDVHLIFPFTFRELNLLKGERFRLAELIHTCIWETKAITEKKLHDIFTKLQASGNRDFNKSKFKLLFVLDGLDESRLQLDFTRSEKLPADFDVTQLTSVDVLLTALIKGKLLPSARVWITTRPAAASQIPRDFVHSMTVVRGFTDPQKVEYFRKRFPDEKQASRIISHIKASRSLFIMCHIPVFCWITATVLKDVLNTKTQAELPKTLTEMYTEFLVFQITLTEEKYGTKKSIQYIQSLAKLAFHQLEKGNLIFYEKDLKDSGINFRKASLYSGVFTEVFKEVRRWKKDNDKGKMFSFVHLSLQEYLAALYVVMSLINDNKNVLSKPELTLESLWMLCKRKSITEVHEIAIDKALQSPNGHLDLFLRFLLGLSLQTNQDLLKYLLKMTKGFSQTNHKTIQSIKERIRENTSPERSINLFYCLNELKDDSLEEEIQQYLSSGSLSTDQLSPALWSALVFILLSSEEALEVFDLKKYSASEEGLLRLLPVVKASNKSLLSGCNLSENSCKALASVLSSQSSKLRELDLSDNDLHDSGVKLLSAGLESPHCALQTLRLSGCMITKEGCASLASALKSNPSHLRELDLSYNHPGDSGVMQLSAGLKDPQWRLETLNLDHGGEQRLKPGLKKYVCELTLDQNTAHRNLKLYDNCMKATTVKEEQPYRHHPERFDCWLQVLCSTGLTGRGYWEVEWEGKVYIAVTYGGIRRKGEGADGCLGANDHSWMLLCDDDGSYSVRHEDRATPIRPWSSPASNRVAVFLDCPAGMLSFYKVASDKLIHIHTFHSTFSEPLYPAFGFGYGFDCFGSSVSLCEVEDNIFSTHC